MRIVWQISVSIGCLGLAGCQADPPGLPDVAVVVLDTLRVDRTTLADPSRDTMPFLAEWAAESVQFEDAYSTSSWTAPAVASLFTGVYPNQHGVDVGPVEPLSLKGPLCSGRAKVGTLRQWPESG